MTNGHKNMKLPLRKIVLIFFMFILLLLVALFVYVKFYKQRKICDCEKVSKNQLLLHSFQNEKEGMAFIPEGKFYMGASAYDQEAKADEYPQHLVKITAFFMDKTLVTQSEFADFVKKTGYMTTAEKPIDWAVLKTQLPSGTRQPSAQQLAPGSMVFIPSDHPIDLNDYSKWWRWVQGANWKHPLGPQSAPFGVDHPVVQVSWYDADAYCKYLHKRLPTEAEWEWAARGGLQDKIYPWGNEDIDEGKIKANTWQGNFPYQNILRDHYFWTSPVKTYPPNGYGLYDMAGNTWQWTSDLYDANFYETLKAKGESLNPRNTEKSYDPKEPNITKYVLRGGSFLCNKGYCAGYRVSARMKNPPDTSMVHVGFRCVSDGMSSRDLKNQTP